MRYIFPQLGILLLFSSPLTAVTSETSEPSVPENPLSEEKLSCKEGICLLKNPSWFEGDALTPCGLNLMNLLENSDDQGLQSSLYRPLIKNLRENPQSKTPTQWNTLLNQALRHYLSWAMGMRKNLTNFDTTTHLIPQPIQQSDVENLVCAQDRAEIEKIGPLHPQALHLKRLLTFYLKKREEGGWPCLPVDFSIAVGQSDKKIELLKMQLERQGYSIPEDPSVSPIVFHPGIQKTLRLFQLDHSLDPSGKLNQASIKELNKSVDERIDQVRLNLERWRWLPPTFQGRSLMVNIPTYQITLLDGETPVKEMSIIVGKTTSQTPSFATSLSVVTLNPSWSVPDSIATQEKLPFFRRNPQKAYAYKITSRQTGERVSPSEINWNSLSKGHFPYHLELDPGHNNPLGPIKFTIPNPFAIYMHGTTIPKLFEKPKRAFSWGCIRIVDPFLLAEFVLNSPQWTKNHLEKAVATRKTNSLRPPEKVSVYLTYFTLWMGPEGRTRFAPDVYQKDPQVLSALNKQLALSATFLEEDLAKNSPTPP
ncbi:MAG: L,D-transpeptidase family protein [Holosporales bacterium]|nr:L,D-transpeptidase family protein [Holosporales bacterium]